MTSSSKLASSKDTTTTKGSITTTTSDTTRDLAVRVQFVATGKCGITVLDVSNATENVTKDANYETSSKECGSSVLHTIDTKNRNDITNDENIISPDKPKFLDNYTTPNTSDTVSATSGELSANAEEVCKALMPAWYKIIKASREDEPALNHEKGEPVLLSVLTYLVFDIKFKH